MTIFSFMKTSEQIYMQLAKAISESDSIPPCQTTDPEIWFSDDMEGSGTHYKIAKQFCSQCPVRDLCLEFALMSEEPYGVWGGLTPRERRAMRVARGRTRGRPAKPRRP